MPEGYDEHSTLDGELAPSTPDNDPARGNGLKVQPETASVYSSSSEPYSSQAAPQQQLAKRTPPPKAPPPVPPGEGDDEDGDDEEKGMLRMSFMEHLEELRSRLIKALGGLVVAFILCIGFCKDLWSVVSAPAVIALTHLGINPPDLAQIKPMEQF